MTDDNENSIVPSRFSLVRVFHAVAAYRRVSPDGSRLVWEHSPEFSTTPLSGQIEKWARTTGNLITAVSPPSLTIVDGSRDGVVLKEHRMSIGVIYSVPAEDIYDPERRAGASPEAWFPPIATGVVG